MKGKNEKKECVKLLAVIATTILYVERVRK